MSCSLNRFVFRAHRAQQLVRARFVKSHRLLQLRRPNSCIHLRRIDAGMPQHRPDFFEIMVLPVDFHRDAMPQIMRLQHRRADHPAIHFAEPPDVFPRHRLPRLARAAPSPGGPEQRRVRIQCWTPVDSRLVDVGPEKLHVETAKQAISRHAPPREGGTPEQT